MDETFKSSSKVSNNSSKLTIIEENGDPQNNATKNTQINKLNDIVAMIAPKRTTYKLVELANRTSEIIEQEAIAQRHAIKLAEMKTVSFLYSFF